MHAGAPSPACRWLLAQACASQRAREEAGVKDQAGASALLHLAPAQMLAAGAALGLAGKLGAEALTCSTAGRGRELSKGQGLGEGGSGPAMAQARVPPAHAGPPSACRQPGKATSSTRSVGSNAPEPLGRGAPPLLLAYRRPARRVFAHQGQQLACASYACQLLQLRARRCTGMRPCSLGRMVGAAHLPPSMAPRPAGPAPPGGCPAGPAEGRGSQLLAAGRAAPHLPQQAGWQLSAGLLALPWPRKREQSGEEHAGFRPSSDPTAACGRTNAGAGGVGLGASVGTAGGARWRQARVRRARAIGQRSLTLSAPTARSSRAPTCRLDQAAACRGSHQSGAPPLGCRSQASEQGQGWRRTKCWPHFRYSGGAMQWSWQLQYMEGVFEWTQ